MFTAVLGYTLPVPRLSPRVYLEFDYASGDTGPGGNVGTFNQLFPNGHSYLGYIDYVGRPNIISASGGLSLTPVRGLILSLQQYVFWRASDRDAIYNKAGAVLRPGTGTTARYVGAEVDLLATYNFTRHVEFYAGYSHFSPASSSRRRARPGTATSCTGRFSTRSEHGGPARAGGLQREPGRPE
jgi:hypothetical protein